MPTAVDDFYSVNEGEILTVSLPGFLGNDTDAEGDPITADLITKASPDGILTAFPDGHFTFTPNAGFIGLTSFSYRITDGSGFDEATVTIEVINDPEPIAVNDFYSVNEGQTLTVAAPGFLANDSDPDGDPFSATQITKGSPDGTLAAFPDGSFTFTPNAGFAGLTSFSYRISDGLGTDEATVVINVINNREPTARDDHYVVEAGEILTIGAPGILANDSDAEGDAISAVLITKASPDGILTAFPDGNFTFTPNAGFTGLTSFGYRISDGLGTDEATVFINVIPDPYNGTAGDDLLIGSDTGNTINGLGGNDTVRGEDGGDSLYGGIGNDKLYGAAGGDYLDGGLNIDFMAGGQGDDTYVLDNAADATVELVGAGYDSTIASVTHALRANIEALYLAFAAGNINGTGNALNNNLIGNGGSNILNGLGGGDYMQGNKGNDTFYVDNAADLVFEGFNEGIDTVRSSLSFALGSDLEKLYLLTGALDGTGNSLSNFIYGNDSSNKIDGGMGADRLFGYKGNDTFTVDSTGDLVFESAGGGTDTALASTNHTLAANVERLTLTGAGNINATGNDMANIIIGNGGNNFIDGKLGSDNLTGGLGQDNFVFTTAPAAANLDTVTDFTVADDTIRLDDAVFAALGPGFLAVSAFHLGAGAADALDRIIYNTAGGALFYDPDGAGGQAQVRIANLSAGLALTNADIFVF
ncbi:MAG: tandem-95 repeat protein [Aestuariivirga sp.]